MTEADRSRALIVRWQSESEYGDGVAKHAADEALSWVPRVQLEPEPIRSCFDDLVKVEPVEARPTPNLPVRYVDTPEHHRRWAEHEAKLRFRELFSDKPLGIL